VSVSYNGNALEVPGGSNGSPSRDGVARFLREV
jgi:hypothetical protein